MEKFNMGAGAREKGRGSEQIPPPKRPDYVRMAFVTALAFLAYGPGSEVRADAPGEYVSSDYSSDDFSGYSSYSRAGEPFNDQSGISDSDSGVYTAGGRDASTEYVLSEAAKTAIVAMNVALGDPSLANDQDRTKRIRAIILGFVKAHPLCNSEMNTQEDKDSWASPFTPSCDPIIEQLEPALQIVGTQKLQEFLVEKLPDIMRSMNIKDELPQEQK